MKVGRYCIFFPNPVLRSFLYTGILANLFPPPAQHCVKPHLAADIGQPKADERSLRGIQRTLRIQNVEIAVDAFHISQVGKAVDFCRGIYERFLSFQLIGNYDRRQDQLRYGVKFTESKKVSEARSK